MKKKYLIILVSFLILPSCSGNREEKQVEEKDSLQINLGESVPDTTNILEWNTLNCNKKGTFNPNIYSKEVLKNTYDLLSLYYSLPLKYEVTLLRPEQIKNLNIDSLTLEYKTKITRLKNMKIVPGKEWENLRKQKIIEMDDEFELKRITLLAYSDPNILIGNRFAKNCNKYADGLASNDTTTLLTLWKELEVELSKKNGDAERHLVLFNEKYNSADKLLFAKSDLMTFGWWNCANDNLRRMNTEDKMESEFNKLFIKMDSICADPD